jgi:hypothetical protein
VVRLYEIKRDLEPVQGGGREYRAQLQLHEIQLLFLGHYVVDVGLEKGVLFQHFGADAALGGGLDFGFRAGGDAMSRISFLFLFVAVLHCIDALFLEHFGG